MILECQKNSYLKEFSAIVQSCESSDGKADTYDVILNDTILFPEGGGQPDDRGTLNGIDVIKVEKRKGQAVHITKTPLDVGKEVAVILDWDRRFDHMQQHSGQHLLSAVIEGIYTHKTTSWYLGEETSFIELDTQLFSTNDMKSLEEVLNSFIRDCLPVTVNCYESAAVALEQVKTRLELPEGESEIRVVTIAGVDDNTCCGTHVSNLSHLQVIKLLYLEKGKKNKTNLYFAVGNRVLSYLDNCINRERKMNILVKCGPNEHLEMVEKLQKSLKISRKKALNSSRELAVLEGKQFQNLDSKPKFYSFHKQEAEAEFISIFANEVNDKSVTLFLTVGDPKGQGQFLIVGEQELLQTLSERICQMLDAKGVAKNGRFKGKANQLSNRSKVDQLFKDVLGID